MPQIKRIRVANIKYDGNQKQMPDLSFELNREDAIFLLANGGGKSLLVQLIIQTILPNQPMGKRRIADLFKRTNYTGHVAVEWSLDNEGDEEHLLCTGFCFTEGRGNKRLDYYNYLINYTASDDFGLASLPLIKGQDLFNKREPIRFQRLKDWLYDLDKQRVEVFDRIYKYHQQLKEYDISPAVWESIAKTNAAEGGVDDYFARSKNTVQLLNNLLIPQLRDVLFSAPEEDDLFAAFDKHRTKLLRMPQIAANIKQFESITAQAEDLIDEVEDLAELQTNREEQKLSLARLGVRFKDDIEAAEESLESLKEEERKLQGEKRELRRQEKSYRIFVKKLEQAKIAAKEKEQIAKLESLSTKRDNLVETKEQLQALNLYNKAQEDKRKWQKHQARLEVLNNKAPQLQERLDSLEHSLAWAWEIKEEELAAARKKKEQTRDELAAEKRENKEEIKLKESTKEQLISRQTTLKNYLADLKEEQKRLESELELSSLAQPQEVITAKEDKLERTKEERRLTHKKVEELEGQKEELEAAKLRLKEEETAIKSELAQLGEQIEEFAEAEEEIAALLAQRGKYWSELLTKRDKVVSFVRARLEEVRSEKSNNAAKLSNWEEKLALVEERDYYVPHHLLVKVKEHLEEQGIYTVLGSEWLAHQDDDVVDIELYVQEYPLLPYAILIEQGQLTEVKQALRRLDLEADFPLALLLRDNLAPKRESDKREKQEVVFHQPQSLELFTVPESFYDFKENLAQQIEVQREELSELKEKEEFYFELKSKVSSFYEEYSQAEVDRLRKDKADLKERKDEVQDEVVKIDEDKAEVKETIKDKQDRINCLAEEIRELKNQIKSLEDFQEEFSQQEAKEEELVQINDDLTKLRSELETLKESQEELNAKVMEKKQQLKEIYQAQEVHQREYEEYDLAEVEGVKTEESYQAVKNQWQSIHEELQQKQSNRREIEELISNYRSNYREKQQRIEELGVSEEWLENNQRQVSRGEIDELKEDAKRAEQKVKEAEDRLQEIENELTKVKTQIETLSQGIAEEFEDGVYLDFAKLEHEEEIKRIKERLTEISSEIEDIKVRSKEVRAEKEDYQLALEELEYQLQSEWDGLLAQVNGQKREELKLSPRKVLRRELEALESIEESLEAEKELVRNNFAKYIRRLKRSNNPQIRQFIKNVEQIMQEEKIYNYDYVENRFLNILETFDKYKQKYKHDQQENEKNLKILAKRSFRRAKMVYESIVELPKNSRISIYGRNFQVIKIDWEATLGSAGEEKIYDYLEEVLDDLQELKEEGAGDDELDKRMRERLKVYNLINIIAPLEECRVRVWKPRSEEVIRERQLDYSDWSAVARWSGGESYSVYMTMFMILVSYIRKQGEGRSNVYKTLLADNPFGKASSAHILNTVFEIAKANQIQLICLTAHRQESILLRFPVAYSLQLRTALGTEIMQKDRLESGFYNLTGVNE